jgi:hypothetical protein
MTYESSFRLRVEVEKLRKNQREEKKNSSSHPLRSENTTTYYSTLHHHDEIFASSSRLRYRRRRSGALPSIDPDLRAGGKGGGEEDAPSQIDPEEPTRSTGEHTYYIIIISRTTTVRRCEPFARPGWTEARRGASRTFPSAAIVLVFISDPGASASASLFHFLFPTSIIL